MKTITDRNTHKKQEELDVNKQLDLLYREEKKTYARLGNIVSKGCNSHEEIRDGRNNFEILSDVPKFFILPLRHKKAPGRISFTHFSPVSATNFTCYVSYTVARPDRRNHIAHK
jgi:hypothetical protein